MIVLKSKITCIVSHPYPPPSPFPLTITLVLALALAPSDHSYDNSDSSGEACIDEAPIELYAVAEYVEVEEQGFCGEETLLKFYQNS